MGNRSKYMAVTAAAAGGGAILARRRARLRRLADGIRSTMLPTHVTEVGDKAHAPGHRHLPVVDDDEHGPERRRGRPWTRHAHGMLHP